MLVNVDDYRQPRGFVGVHLQVTRNPEDPVRNHEYDQVGMSVTREDLADPAERILDLLFSAVERDRIAEFIHSGGVGGEWARMARKGSGSCPVCRASHSNLEQVGERLERRAFVLAEIYQMDRIHRCGRCGTFWLEQYWEEFDEDHQYAEFDKRYEQWTELTADDVALIAAAMETGAPLPHRQFWG